MKKDRLTRFYAVLAIFLILIIFFMATKNLLGPYLSTPEAIKNAILGFGVLGPIVLVVLLFLEVIIGPVPGPLIIIASGYIYGRFTGALLALVGTIIGSTGAFFLSRKLGRPFVEKIISKKELNHFDKSFQKNGVKALWLGYVFPLSPSDSITYAVGLTNIKFRKFFKIMAIGFIPNIFLLTYFGDHLSEGLNRYSITLMVSVILFLTVFIYRHKVRTYVSKRLKNL